ncbi:hypothetical protein [Streptomyces gilvosporeus]|uniref:Small secreted protein n=1 Tax=Streptomyces gilvosporeus TaxID=553510 RepID=A0A1V0TJX2_9ACTN|nr:hypothetical protein [Streptomyces gilvosporeus]ARF53235.1 hypothetical protein B1H19_02800 [Streptomyces gilvosporeus]
MMLRSLARGTTTLAAVLLLTAPVATTVHAAEAPACAKEQLAYMDAEDKASATDKEADAAQDALSQSERDRQTLNQTDEHLYNLTYAMDRLIRNNEQVKSRNVVIKAAEAAAEGMDRGDAATVADAADKAEAAGKQFLKDTQSGHPMEFDRVESLVYAVGRDAAAARKATAAKDYGTLKEKAQQSRDRARSAQDAVAPARADLKTCLKKATA